MNGRDQQNLTPAPDGEANWPVEGGERHARILEAVLSSPSDFIFVLDSGGRHLFVGESAVRALGLPRADILGKSLFEIGLSRPLAVHVDHYFQRVLASGQPLQSEMEALTPFGHRRFQYFFSPIFSDSHEIDAVLVNSRDVTDQQRARDALSESEIRFQTLLEHCRDAVGVSKAGVQVYANRAYADLFGFKDPSEITGISIADVIAPSERAAIAERIRSRAAGTDVEAFYVTRGLRRNGEEFDMETRVSTYLWRDEMYSFVILRDVSEERRRDSRRREQTSALKSHQDWLEAVLNLLPVGLVFVEPRTGRVVFANRAADDLAGAPLARGLTMDEARDAYVCFDDDGERLSPKDVPMTRVARGERLQGLEIQWRTPGGDRPLLVFGDMIPALHGHGETGVVVFQDIAEQKDLRNRLSASYEREWLINWIGATIRGATNSEDIPAATVAALGSALRADRCYFVFYDIEQGRAWVKNEWRVDGLATLVGEHKTSSHDSILQAYRRSVGQTLVIEDVTADARFPDLSGAFSRLGLRAGIRVPLFENQHLVASLVVAMARDARAWTPDEIALTEAVASVARTAAEAARTLERERKIATTLQNALKPAAPSSAPGLDVADFHRAALEEASVGGDFYDVFALNDGVTALVVGDVSGKGLAAAAQVATVRNMLRTVLYLYDDLALALATLNGLLFQHDLLKGFVTLFVARFDASCRMLSYASCGHEPSLLQSVSDGAVRFLHSTGPVLGIFADAEFDVHCHALSPGDRFLIYTDGLSEAGPDRMHLLGPDGLARALGAQTDPNARSLVSRILEEVNAWAGRDLRDDACLLAAVVV